MLLRISAQDGFTQTSRAAVDQDNQLLLAQAQLPEFPGVHHLLDRLQLGEVVAATNRAQRLVEFRGFELRGRENLPRIAFPRMLQVEAELSPAVELEVALNQVGFEQGHAAADVPADQVRVDESLGYKGRAHRAALAGVQIREPDCQAHPFKFRRRIELAERFAFDPAPGRGEKAHIGLDQSIHASFLARQSGIQLRVGHWSRDCADTSGFSDRRAD